jgi:hypothetical protein
MFRSWTKTEFSDSGVVFTACQFSLKEHLILLLYPVIAITTLLLTPTIHDYATSVTGFPAIELISSLVFGLFTAAFTAVRGLRVSLFVDGHRLVACKKWWFLAYDCEDFVNNWVVFANLENKCVIAERVRTDDGPDRLPESVLAAEEYASFAGPNYADELMSEIRLAAGRYTRAYPSETDGDEAGTPPDRIIGLS